MRPNPLRLTRITFGALIAVLQLAWTATAGAQQLSLTLSGVGRFTLDDYAIGFIHESAPFNFGPTGIAFLPNQGVLVSDVHADAIGPGGHCYLYSLPSHTNGQLVGPANVQFQYPSSIPPGAMAQVQRNGVWHYYVALGSEFDEIDSAGHVLDVIKQGVGAAGVAPFPPGVSSPYSGHIFLSSLLGGGLTGFVIFDIDPVSKVAVPFAQSNVLAYDALAFSKDGNILYVTANNAVHALTVPGAIPIWDASAPPDTSFGGVAVGVGDLEGYVYVSGSHQENSPFGVQEIRDLWEIGTPFGLHPGIARVIATGGKRGSELLATDPNVSSPGATYPTLLIMQDDRIVRLDPPGGGWLGPPTSSLLPVQNTTDVPTDAEVGASIRVSPNPAAGPTRIDFTLEKESSARLEVLDVQGRQVAVLFDGMCAPGPHHEVWSGGAAGGKSPAGIYLVRLHMGGRVLTQRFVMMR